MPESPLPESPIQNQRAAEIRLPSVPVLSVNAREVALLSPDGELRVIPHAQARIEIGDMPVLVCHEPYTRVKMGAGALMTRTLPAFDLLELFAFVHPAKFCVPTPAGLAKALGLTAPKEFEDYPFTLLEAAEALLADLRSAPRRETAADPAAIAEVMGLQGKGWRWTPYVLAALGAIYDPARPLIAKPALNIWKYLPEWSEEAPPPPASHHPVTESEALERLSRLVKAGGDGKTSENRREQADYSAKISAAFAPGEAAPHVVLAEAGTGVGKTLGYLAPASVWAEKNDGPVWVSTYTKNLQGQIDRELDRLYPHPDVKNAKVAVRKGRENYLCLLNFEDEAAGAALTTQPKQAIAAGLMARWAEVTRDGDLNGPDFPGWLPGLVGAAHTRGLADRRGECIYSACSHYHRCFVERAARKSRRANIVIANHALVMIQTALATPDEALPQRYVFDEGHHIFDAADSAFAGHLTARETHDLRRWLRGAEGGRVSRAKGLKRRAEDIAAGDPDAQRELDDILQAALFLPAHGWQKRLKDGEPQGAAEEFLLALYRQVTARARNLDSPYSIETETFPLTDDVRAAAARLLQKTRALQKPMNRFSARLKSMLAEQADTLDTDASARRRIAALAVSLDRRADGYVAAWAEMLETLQQEKTSESHAPASFVDWMEIEREAGSTVDVGLYRHWVDPLVPFAAALKPAAHGIAITSATLTDTTGNIDENWRVARERTGADHLNPYAFCFNESSPYDYARQARAFIITDIDRDSLAQTARAYQSLFTAAGGGGLGLFTAIQRLRAVQEHLAAPLEEAGISLFAQHVDEMETGTLIDMFREDTNACLLGTDAVRDGVDIPGESLRLVIYDRVPWPRPTILHKARRKAFGGRSYDEQIARLKIRQAFGRLIRRESDRGVFVMMDGGFPSSLLGALPESMPVRRCGLAEAVHETRLFLDLSA